MADFEPRLEIIIQPQTNLRFRYESETGTHGVLNGRNSTDKYPTIRLTVPAKCYDHQYYAVINLYKYSKSSDTEDPKLAAELLVEKSTTLYSYGPIIELMTKQTDGVYLYSLVDRYIVCPNKKEMKATLRRKYEETEKIISGGIVLSPRKEIEIDKQDLQKAKEVCLGFSVYTKDMYGNYTLVCKPLLSEPINSGRDIRIVKNCNPSCKSGDDMTLLVTNAKPNEVEVHLYELGDVEKSMMRTTVWDHRIQGKDLRIHKQAAISFNMPEYTGSTQDTSINGRLVIKRPKHGDESNFIAFRYQRNNVDEVSPFKRRKIANRDEFDTAKKEYLPTSSVLSRFTGIQIYKDSARGITDRQSSGRRALSSFEVQLQAKLNKFEKLVLKNPENLKEVLEKPGSYEEREFNFLCYDAIKSDMFANLLIKIKEHNLENHLHEIRNSQGETLLHYACKLNKSGVLKSLIDMGCAVDAVDTKSYTPLYLSVTHENQECVKVFVDLLKDSQTYVNKELEKDLKKMLTIYDEQGFTLLHKAVLKNQLELVESILYFCKNTAINTAAYRVLGEGDTLLHLATSKGLKEMAQLIYKHDPETIYHRNYAGEAIIDDDEALLQLEILYHK